VAIVTRATISNEITDSSVDRQSYAAYAIEVVATLGLSIGLAVLLFSSRPRADDEGARSWANLSLAADFFTLRLLRA
jgi:hypothetical protein